VCIEQKTRRNGKEKEEGKEMGKGMGKEKRVEGVDDEYKREEEEEEERMKETPLPRNFCPTPGD